MAEPDIWGVIEQRATPAPAPAPVEGWDPWATIAQRVGAPAPSGIVQRYLEPAGRGVADIVEGAAQLVGHGLGAVGIMPQQAQQLDKDIQQREKAYQASRQPNAGTDWGRIAGNILGGLPAAAVVGPGIGGGAALSGAVTGAMQPVTSGDYWPAKAAQVGTGAAGGALGSAMLRGVARVIAPKASQNPAVQTLLREGVTPTPGQLAGGAAARVEAKATSLPVAGDIIKGAQERGVQELNVAAANRALAPIGEKVTEAPGRGMIQEVEAKLGAAYDEVLPKLRLKADQQLATDLGDLAQLVQELPAAQATRFRQVLDQQVLKRIPTGTADGETVKVIQSKLGYLTRGYLKSTDADQRELGRAIGSLKQHLDAALERSNPQFAPELRKINEGWANFERVRRAAASTGADEGVFSPAQLQRAVKAKGNERQFARGNALMQDLSEAGKSVMGSAYPDSGTAGRLLSGAMLSGQAPRLSMAETLIGAGLMPMYMPGGRQVAAALLAKRPSGAGEMAELMRQLSRVAGPAGGALVPSQ